MADVAGAADSAKGFVSKAFNVVTKVGGYAAVLYLCAGIIGPTFGSLSGAKAIGAKELALDVPLEGVQDIAGKLSEFGSWIGKTIG